MNRNSIFQLLLRKLCNLEVWVFCLQSEKLQPFVSKSRQLNVIRGLIKVSEITQICGGLMRVPEGWEKQFVWVLWIVKTCSIALPKRQELSGYLRTLQEVGPAMQKTLEHREDCLWPSLHPVGGPSPGESTSTGQPKQQSSRESLFPRRSYGGHWGPETNFSFTCNCIWLHKCCVPDTNTEYH